MKPEELLAAVTAKFPAVEQAAVPVKDYPTLRLKSPAELVPLTRFLKEDLGFDYLEVMTAVDWLGPVHPEGYLKDAENPNPFLAEKPPAPAAPPKPPVAAYKPVFDLVWCLANIQKTSRMFLRLEVPRDNPAVPSLTPLFHAADWQEREAFDLMGITFEGHPNLKKILTADWLVGHPLRKDYVHVKDKYDG